MQDRAEVDAQSEVEAPLADSQVATSAKLKSATSRRILFSHNGRVTPTQLSIPGTIEETGPLEVEGGEEGGALPLGGTLNAAVAAVPRVRSESGGAAVRIAAPRGALNSAPATAVTWRDGLWESDAPMHSMAPAAPRTDADGAASDTCSDSTHTESPTAAARSAAAGADAPGPSGQSSHTNAYWLTPGGVQQPAPAPSQQPASGAAALSTGPVSGASTSGEPRSKRSGILSIRRFHIFKPRDPYTM